MNQDALIKAIILAANQLGATVIPPRPAVGTKTVLTVTFPSGEITSVVIDQLYPPAGSSRTS